MPVARVAMAASILSPLNSRPNLQLSRPNAGAIGRIGTGSSLRRSPPRDHGQEMATQMENGRLREKVGRGMSHGTKRVGVETGMALMQLRWGRTRARCTLLKVCQRPTDAFHGSIFADGALTIEVLQSIKRDWDFMTDAECIPVHVALSLMDTSTLGKADRVPDFLHMYNQIQKTLKAIVNGQYMSSWVH